MATQLRAKIRCQSESHAERKVDNKNLRSTKDRSINSRIELTYDVLTIIFKNLNAKDLCSAARVCRSWYEAANNEKKIRSVSPFTLLGDFDSVSNDVRRAKVLISSFKLKPMLSMAFTRPFESAPPTAREHGECLCKQLPTNSFHIRVGNSRIVEDQLESENPDRAALLLLPTDPDVTIDAVFVPSGGVRGPSRSDSSPLFPEKTRKKLEKLAHSRNKVKCFVILSSEESMCEAAILTCIPRDNERTLSGTVVSGLLLCKNSKTEKICSRMMRWIVLLISGPSVQSWSLVLQGEIDTKEKIEEKLRKFKKLVQLKKKSIAFMFACQERGECMFDEPNVESTIFKKLFPEVPLIGSSGGGEFGDCSVDRSVSRINIYSTVFMIVTYGQS